MFVIAGKYRILCFISLLLSGVLLMLSCNDDTETSARLDKKFREADSTILAGNSPGGLFLFSQLRPQLRRNNPLLCEYYCEMCLFNYNTQATGSAFADSALNFFADVKRIKKYPGLYAMAELRKGDCFLYECKYALALTHYFRCQENMPPGSSFESELNSKIGSIYYGQANYRSAAKYWAAGYHLIDNYKGKMDRRKFFYDKQGSLNNTGFCYEMANMLDSARWYYETDLALINAADTSIINKQVRYSALTVLYDNLGGLKVKQGDYKGAEADLIKSLSYPIGDHDGIHIPPITKLIDLYLKTNQLRKAAPLFERSKQLLDKFSSANLKSAEKWNQLYASYLFRKNRIPEAYQYQSRYIQLRDSLHEMQSNVNHIDIDKQMAGLHQEQLVNELKESDKQTKMYILGISVIALLSLVIGYLIYRTLKRTTLLNMQLENALSDVERANKNYMRIMRVMAHDIINPLAGITGIASILLLKKSLSPKIKQDIRLIEASGLHSMQMINQLLKTGLSDGKDRSPLQLTDLRALVKDSVDLLKFKAAEKNQQLIFEDKGEPIMANVNREEIWRVVNNIIVNAIKFSHQEGIVKVGLLRTAENVRFSVADNGLGIPAQSRDMIFEMFTPAKRVGTDGEQPFGLGLSICKRLVERHHGQIWFEDNPEGGTIFIVDIPVGD